MAGTDSEVLTISIEQRPETAEEDKSEADEDKGGVLGDDQSSFSTVIERDPLFAYYKLMTTEQIAQMNSPDLTGDKLINGIQYRVMITNAYSIVNDALIPRVNYAVQYLDDTLIMTSESPEEKTADRHFYIDEKGLFLGLKR